MLIRSLVMVGLMTSAVLVPSESSAGCTYPHDDLVEPAFILVGGWHEEGAGMAPDLSGTFSLVIRDCSFNPIENAEVVVDFSACSDIVLCQTQAPGQIVDCTLKLVRGYTDAAGRVTFAVAGAANNTGAVGTFAAPGCGLDGVEILADGESLEFVTAAVLDQNGAIGGNGVNAADLACVADDFGSAALNGTYRGRADYNFDGANSALDLSAYSDYLGAAALGDGSGGGCPGTAYCP